MQLPRIFRTPTAIAVVAVACVALLLTIGFARGWHHRLNATLGAATEAPSQTDHEGHDHEGHDHDHEGHDHAGHDHAGHDHGPEDDAHGAHDAEDVIELSPEARRGMGLETGRAVVGTFDRRITFPGTVVAWPGRTHVTISAPLTGSVTSVHVARGESVMSGAKLYTLRLTHQDLVRIQSEFLQTLGEADVERQEVQRLREVAQSGAIAGRSLLERQYALERLQAELRAMREALLLHGLSEPQVRQIENDRKLVREITIYAPVLHADRSLHDDALEGHAAPLVAGPADYQPPEEAGEGHADPQEHIDTQFVVTELTAERGQSVDTGDPLTVLANYEYLLAEGHAFPQDADQLIEAARAGAPVQAVLESGAGPQQIIEELEIAYVGSEVRTDTRVLPFYVPLENQRVREEQRLDRQFTSWRFRPGQRLRLRVAVEQVQNVIVLPVEAVAQEGLESYVFVVHGDHLERRPVQVVLRDQLQVAIANSGAVRPGQTVALTDAHQLQMAIKNRAGGGADPHAGHSH